jgi:hypothetical protein
MHGRASPRLHETKHLHAEMLSQDAGKSCDYTIGTLYHVLVLVHLIRSMVMSECGRSEGYSESAVSKFASPSKNKLCHLSKVIM